MWGFIRLDTYSPRPPEYPHQKTIQSVGCCNRGCVAGAGARSPSSRYAKSPEQSAKPSDWTTIGATAGLNDTKK